MTGANRKIRILPSRKTPNFWAQTTAFGWQVNSNPA
jgi:hypothetical protein